jgi:ATP-dependent helicase/nuclease subunit A
MMSPLRIYKASAGSGKTYALTMEYLSLLFRFPGMHRHILAVTFTNKAAGEMKHRILNRLNALASGTEGTDRDELGELMSVSGMDEKGVRERAARMLDAILNDYSGFSVGTIDKFFQSVIRSFTREIGIQPGYNLELDHQRILSLAVDRLFQEIQDDRDLQAWLIRFAEERIEESRSWNFRADIIQLGMQLFSEAFQHLFLDKDLAMLEKGQLESYLSDLERVESEVREKILHNGSAAMEHMRREGVGIGDFRLKERSVASLFRDAADGRALNFTAARIEALTLPEKWLGKAAPAGLVRLTGEILMPLLVALYNQQVVLNTARVIRENFYTLGILGDILERINAYTRERNIFLMADSGRFLRGIIAGNQVPFVYERTGTRYNHIMLDEFQDTSVFQYDNFRPLLDNSLASGHENLVVGDVKQSIYRWRNSDWQLLASSLEKDFSHQELRVESLTCNFRSREQIIRFNNTLFQIIPGILAGQIAAELHGSGTGRDVAESQVSLFRKAYEDAVQQIPEQAARSGGMVHVELFGSEAGSFHDQVLDRLPEWIQEIHQQGFEPGEIAILVRTRREGISVANRLLRHAGRTGDSYHFRLISNESLLLMHNVSVSLLVSALKFLVRPGDLLNEAELKYRCFLAGVVQDTGPDRLFEPGAGIEAFLPGDFLQRSGLLRQLPLYELIETLIQLFGLGDREEDLPYIQALQDLVIDLQRNEPLSITGFLDDWEQHASQRSISVSEELNAIRILTIHKAKGLEFKCVLVPFCDWELTTDPRKLNFLWCETAGTPFGRIPVVPVRYGSSMKHTLFSRDYYRERMKGYMDNLNLMYVAFTRARDALFVGIPGKVETTGQDVENGPAHLENARRNQGDALRNQGDARRNQGDARRNQGDAPRNSGDLLLASFGEEPYLSPCLSPWKGLLKGDRIRIGSWQEKEREGTTTTDPWKFTSYPVIRRERSLRVRLRSDAYFVDEEGAFSSRLSYGTIMHRIFSGIVTEKDLEPLLLSMQKQGLIPEDERMALLEKISGMIALPGIREWFEEGGNRKIFNERSILCGDGKVIRPDRVIVDRDRVTVVDFKFGLSERPDHRTQVQEYVQELNSMGHTGVEGYLWYAMLGKTVKVTGT